MSKKIFYLSFICYIYIYIYYMLTISIDTYFYAKIINFIKFIPIYASVCIISPQTWNIL